MAGKSPSVAAEIDDPEGLAGELFKDGNLLYRANRYQDAIDKYEKALKISVKYNLPGLQANILERMASVRMNDNAGYAFKLYLEALRLFEKIPDSPGIAKVFNIIGFYKSDLREYDSAEYYFMKAIGINTRLKNRYYLIENRGNLATLYTGMGHHDKAERIYNELIAELTTMNDSMNLQVIYYQLAKLYLQKERPDSALFLLDQAISIAGPVKDTALLCTLFGIKGELLLNQGETALATELLNKSVRCSRAIDDLYTEAEALKYLIVIDSIKGNFREAFHKSIAIGNLKDTLAVRKMQYDLQKIELQHSNEKRKEIIEYQQNQIAGAKKEKILYRILLIFAIFMGILVIALLLLRLSNQRKKRAIAENELIIQKLQVASMEKDREINRLNIEKVSEALKGKEKELMLSVMNLEQKREFLNYIVKKIREVTQTNPSSDPLVLVNEIISSIKLHLNTSGEAELFSQQFTQVHLKFHENLKRAHHELTLSETKFCAYLRLNISGSMIAQYLNVTQEAIRKTRYRIRKKLKLKPDESLEDYISRF